MGVQVEPEYAPHAQSDPDRLYAKIGQLNMELDK